MARANNLRTKRRIYCARVRIPRGLRALLGRGEIVRWREMTSIQKIAEAADAQNVKRRLSPRTIERHMSALSEYWERLAELEIVNGSNPFRGHRKHKTSRRAKNRPKIPSA